MVDVNPLNEDISEFQENERPPSEQLVELHLYLVPKEKWLEKRKLAKNQAVDHTISVGFVRVLPQTVLSDLRKEMHRQLGIDSVPQSFVFLRSVGRNFTQVRPKQEMEMKVKNYMPPFAPEPELYLKEGHYTGPSNWSQGEDSGLEESLADSNSQRSHDRATPESLTDDPLILPKLTDYLGVPLRPDEGSRASMPPGAMTVSMSTDGIASPALNAYRTRKGDPDATSRLIGPIRPDRTYGSSDDVRYTRIRERSLEKVLSDTKETEFRQKMRASSWNRRQKRGSSKERGGTQLPTWAETRTTRLRRSKALGENINNNNNNMTLQQQKTKRMNLRNESSNRTSRQHHFDAEDEADDDDEAGKFLMERIRANSRCLKAQLSSHHSRRMTQEAGTPARERIINKNGRVHNGIYTMHTRRNQKMESEQNSAAVESTTIKLLDDKGQAVEMVNAVNQKSESTDEPEIVHMHKLSADGEDARTVDTTGSGRASATGEKLENISEVGTESAESNNPSVEINEPTNDSDRDSKTDSKLTPDYEQSEDSGTGNEEPNTNDLEEGKLVNQNGKLTIEVEVKELGSSEGSTDTPLPAGTSEESNDTPPTAEDIGDYDSFRVYSEQNVQAASVDPALEAVNDSRRASRSDPKNDVARLNKARQARGVYLRRMEHRNSQSNINRTQSNEQVTESMNSSVGGSPTRRYGGRSVSYNRRSSKRRLEKWSSTAASTGDLREAAWDYSNDMRSYHCIKRTGHSSTMFAKKDRILNAPKFYRRRMYGGLPLGGYVRTKYGNRRLLRSYLPPGELRSNRSYRTVFYPPSYFTGRLSRFVRAHHAATRAKATDDFFQICQRYNLLPVYVPVRRPYRPCHIIRMAKKAGELFIREKVRSAYRRWLDKKIAPFIGNGPLGPATPPTGKQQLGGRGARKEVAAFHSGLGRPVLLRSLSRSRMSVSGVATPPLNPAALSGVANVDLWSDRNSTPIFPLPIVRNPARYGRHKIGRKRVCALIRTPTPPNLPDLPELYSEERLLVILNEVRGETRLRQKQREELLRRIKQLQTRAHQRREQVREMWRKRYLEAKKITPRLEEECSRLRQELEKLHRELLAKVQAGVWALLTISGKTERPSNKLSYKIMIARLLQEIEDLTRRVEATRLKLHTEVKLRSMAEKDVRNLREELLKKKIQVTLTRNQEQAAMGNGLRQQYFISAV